MEIEDTISLEPTDEEAIEIMENTISEIPDDKRIQAEAFIQVKRLWQDGKITKKEAIECYLTGEIKSEIIDKLE